MSRKIIVTIFTTISAVCFLASCRKSTTMPQDSVVSGISEPEIISSSSDSTAQATGKFASEEEAKQYLKDTYGCTDEELEGINAQWIISAYAFDDPSMGWESADVRQVIREAKENGWYINTESFVDNTWPEAENAPSDAIY